MWEGQLGSPCSDKCETTATWTKAVMGINKATASGEDVDRVGRVATTVAGIWRVREEAVSGDFRKRCQRAGGGGGAEPSLR